MDNTTKSLKDTVAAFKIEARNSLRMELISPRLSKITHYENHLADIAKSKTDAELVIKVEQYEISKLDSEHPLFNDKKESKESKVKNYQDLITRLDEETVEINKLITDQNEAIAKIESGETKVSLEALNNLVDAMIEANAIRKTGNQ